MANYPILLLIILVDRAFTQEAEHNKNEHSDPSSSTSEGSEGGNQDTRIFGLLGGGIGPQHSPGGAGGLHSIAHNLGNLAGFGVNIGLQALAGNQGQGHFGGSGGHHGQGHFGGFGGHHGHGGCHGRPCHGGFGGWPGHGGFGGCHGRPCHGGFGGQHGHVGPHGHHGGFGGSHGHFGQHGGFGGSPIGGQFGGKSGFCPPPRPQCPPVRQFTGGPQVCSSDFHCTGSDKCCFDVCLNQQVCKPIS